MPMMTAMATENSAMVQEEVRFDLAAVVVVEAVDMIVGSFLKKIHFFSQI